MSNFVKIYSAVLELFHTYWRMAE